jgi:hypothetical protein
MRIRIGVVLFIAITGNGQPFGRKPFHLKVTRLSPFSGKTRTGKSQIVSNGGAEDKQPRITRHGGQAADETNIKRLKG